MKISIVSPEYKGAEMVDELVGRLKSVLSALTGDFEIILVNDASPDNTWEMIRRQCALDPRVKGLNLSRNYGENFAITAGLNYVSGDWVVVMDCDLQNRPEDIPLLLAKAQEGYDIVYARRAEKKFGFFKKLGSKIYHGLLGWLSGVRQDSAVAEFGIYSGQVIAEYVKLPEVARSFANLITILGFKSAFVDVRHDERASGGSSYTFSKLVKIAFDVILSNSNRPLKMAVELGAVIVTLAVVLIVYTVIEHCVNPDVPVGFSSTFISIWLLGGLNIFILGVVGLYIDRIFNQVKGRPLFIVAEKLNFEKDEQK